jgi:hypothetical protein
VAERLGFVNHVVEEGELLKKAREIAEAIVRNNQDMVMRYKSVINDGLKLDLGHALELEKVMCFLFMLYTCTVKRCYVLHLLCFEAWDLLLAGFLYMYFESLCFL